MKKIIIIGSGIGGLTTGNLLAKKGHRVMIFESHSAPGGYTAGFRREEFYFESGTLALESSGVFLKTMDDLGLKDRVHLIKRKDRWLSPFFDFQFDSYAGFKQAVYGGFSTEKKALDGYFIELDAICEAMRPLMFLPLPMQFSGAAAIKAMLPYIFSGRKFFQIQKRYKNQNVVDIADRHFKRGTPLHRFFTSLGYPKMGILALGGLFSAATEDYWHIVEGMQQVADVLAGRFKEFGGELKLRAPVERILTKNGTAMGVISKGTTFEADAVISACDYKSTFLELLDDPSIVPQEQLIKIREASVSESVFTVYLGLSLTNEKLKQFLRGFSVTYNSMAYDFDYNDPRDPNHFQKCGFNLYSPSLVNSELAPKGKSSLMIQALCPFRWQDNWHKDDPEKYLSLKKKAKRALVERAETIIPELPSWVEFEEAATPLTYERYTHNTDGATSAWSWDPGKPFYEGGMMRLNVMTPVKNLFIGSCWAGQIGGIPSALGAAYLCVKKIK